MLFKKTTTLLLATLLLATSAACGAATPAAPSTSREASSSSVQEPVSASSMQEALPNCPTPAQRLELNVAVIKGPSAIGMLNLMELAENQAIGFSPANDYKFTTATAPDQVVGGVISGEYDMAVLPPNLAATVYNKTQGKVQLVTINTLGVLYLVEAGDSIKTAADLKGKTICLSGQGTVPEYTLDYILRGNGLTPGVDVQVEYRSEHSEVSTLLAAGKVDVAVLPQPFLAAALAQNDKLRVALDLTREWDTVAGGAGSLVMGGIVVQKQLLEEHPESIKAFLEEYQASTSYATDPANLDRMAELTVKHGIIAKEAIAKAAIPSCNIVFLAGKDMQSAASGFLKILFEANPQSVGGKLPDEEFYYIP